MSKHRNYLPRLHLATHKQPTTYRYEIDPIYGAQDQEFSFNVGTDIQDFSISADGVRVAFIAGMDFYGIPVWASTVIETGATNFLKYEGRFNTSLGSINSHPNAGEYSPTDNAFALSDGRNLELFETATNTRQASISVDNSLCGLNYNQFDDLKFSPNGQHVFGKLVCGRNEEKTVLLMYPVSFYNEPAAIAWVAWSNPC